MKKQDTELDGPQNGEPHKPGTFVKGDSRINRTDGPRGRHLKPSPLLRDMRAVYEQDESKDRGPAQKALRKMFQENTDKFIARLGRLEQAFQAEVFKEDVIPVVTEVDEGTEKSVALIENLLAKYHAQRAEEDAEFAKRPDAAAIGVTLQKKLAQSLEREAFLRKQIDEL